MIYKKYAIEITYDVEILSDIIPNSNTTYNNQINISFNKMHNVGKNIIYMDNNGILGSYPTLYDFYEEAYDILNRYYYITSYYNGQSFINRIVKIVEAYNDIPIPLTKNRKYKLAKLKGEKIIFN